MAERSKNGPYWVKAWIADLSQLTDMFRDEDGKVDYDALGREEYQFRMALARKDFSLSSRAKKVWDEALGPYKHRISAALKDKESSAGAPIREDGVDRKSGMPATISSEPEVLNLAYSGEFANVRLTQEQYNDLLQHVGNMNDCNRLIDDFSANLADGTTTSTNHFATLKKWANARKRFNDKDTKPTANTMTFQEIEGKRQSDQLRKYGLLK